MLGDLVSVYHELNQQKLSIEKRLDELKSRIKEQVAIGETTVGDYKITRTQTERRSLDSDKVLLLIGKDNYIKCEKVTQYETLKITRP